MIRFVSESARTYKRKPIHKLIVPIIVGAGLLNSFSFNLFGKNMIGRGIRTFCVAVMAGCAFYLMYKLLEKLVKRPEYGSSGFQDEFIEFHEDHLRICQLDSVIGKGKYDDVMIYFEDIDYSRIKDMTLGIQLKNKVSEKTKMNLADHYDSGYYEVFLARYPKEVTELLTSTYKIQLKVVQS